MIESSTRTTHELLSAVLGVRAAARLRSLVDLSSLRGLAISELTHAYGLSDVAARKTVAVVALAHRLDASPTSPGTRLASSADIARHAQATGLSYLQVEQFHVLMLDAKNRLMEDMLCSRGVLTASLVHPREVFCPAIRTRAASIVVVHNHPSGDPEPSAEDLEVTRRLQAVGELVGIRLADHVIVAERRYVSFLERGLLPQ